MEIARIDLLLHVDRGGRQDVLWSQRFDILFPRLCMYAVYWLDNVMCLRLDGIVQFAGPQALTRKQVNDSTSFVLRQRRFEEGEDVVYESKGISHLYPGALVGKLTTQLLAHRTESEG